LPRDGGSHQQQVVIVGGGRASRLSLLVGIVDPAGVATVAVGRRVPPRTGEEGGPQRPVESVGGG
ncbi:unnamed protein product, partial [Allacma fusca]